MSEKELSGCSRIGMECVVASSGNTAFSSFAANFMRVRKIEAQIAQESLINRESFRASLVERQGSGQPNLSNVFELHRMSDAAR